MCRLGLEGVYNRRSEAEVGVFEPVWDTCIEQAKSSGDSKRIGSGMQLGSRACVCVCVCVKKPTKGHNLVWGPRVSRNAPRKDKGETKNQERGHAHFP